MLPRESLFCHGANFANQAEGNNELSSHQVTANLSSASNELHNVSAQKSPVVALPPLTKTSRGTGPDRKLVRKRM